MCRNLPCCCGNGAAHCVPNACQIWQAHQPIFCNADEKSTRLKKKKTLTISDSELPGATFSLGVICFYSLLEARLLWRWRTLGQEENPLLFLKNMMLRQCRGTQCCRNRCEVDEMRCTYDNCSFFFYLNSLSKSVYDADVWALKTVESPSAEVCGVVVKISLDNRMAWNICTQMWTFN